MDKKYAWKKVPPKDGQFHTRALHTGELSILLGTINPYSCLHCSTSSSYTTPQNCLLFNNYLVLIIRSLIITSRTTHPYPLLRGKL
jgi:hypothetical protein